MGRTCAGLTTKVTALVDTHGRAVTLALAAGPTADVVAGADVPLPAGKRVVADKGYASDAFRAEGRAAGSTPCIPPRKGRKRPSCYHRGWYRQRHKVENFFQRMKRFRRVASRYEKLDFYFLSVLQLAAIIDWLRF